MYGKIVVTTVKRIRNKTLEVSENPLENSEKSVIGIPPIAAKRNTYAVIVTG